MSDRKMSWIYLIFELLKRVGVSVVTWKEAEGKIGIVSQAEKACTRTGRLSINFCSVI